MEKEILLALKNRLRPLLDKIVKAGGVPLFVGGCVRDAFLGIEPKDVDIEVHGMTGYEDLKDALRDFTTDEVGKAFGVLKVHFKGDVLDISLPRRDSKTSKGHTGFQVEVDPTLSFRDAAARRDFTINAIMFSPMIEEFIDPFNGIGDLKGGILRHTSPAFAEDPLRVLRLAQFAARFDFKVSPGTIQLCSEMKDEFPTISRERIWTEFEKIGSKGKNVQAAIKVLKETGWSKFFWGILWNETAADETAKFCDSHDIEDRATLVLASLALSCERSQVFLEEIGAPQKLVQIVQKIRQHGIVFHDDIVPVFLMKARTLYPVTLRQVSAFTCSDKMLAQAEKFGVADGPTVPLLTGDDLLAKGYVQGPELGNVLKRALYVQDTKALTTKEQVLAQI